VAKIIRYIPAVIWMVFIFYLSSRQTIGIDGTRTERFLIFKTFHLIEYAVLYILFAFATRKPSASIGLSYTNALSDELHQHFVPGREGKFTDTLIDLLGILIGVLVLKIILQIHQKIIIKKS